MTYSTNPTVVWFRRDLRLSDNRALTEAVTKHAPILPIYIWGYEGDLTASNKTRSVWWLLKSLRNLDHDLKLVGSKLVILKGNPLGVISKLAYQISPRAIYWNKVYEPNRISLDRKISLRLDNLNIEHSSFEGHLLWNPEEIRNVDGGHYQTFTAFWNKANKLPMFGASSQKPNVLPMPLFDHDSISIDELERNTTASRNKNLVNYWSPSEDSANQLLGNFISTKLEVYEKTRNIPHISNSKLSPYIHFGQVSPFTILSRTISELENIDAQNQFLKQLAWRDFAHYVLIHNPGAINNPIKPQFQRFPWVNDPKGFSSWKLGETGYPIVDAGLRELSETGFMHNRVRMVAASFLTKHLLIHWNKGARHFEDMLVDADLANNIMGWQWVAGTGTDSMPYFRIFNPTLQGKRFDPHGKYVKRWIPELSKIPQVWVHQPWQSPERTLSMVGIKLGKTYPFPIIDHDMARVRALDAYKVTQLTNKVSQLI
ncbi:MAG: deoxyribodipyrimidine photolyase [Dehalococcoidia bacterium]|nr:deoxyribodipyrimidine photolyase [Dehalococcoidia bacterium]